ncbi:MAG: restriction endonuclease [Symbiobacterium sp.]|uniref:restriction endonuclease n=1 Tax=Symbiobacterium sp. TaxID=1971213 RepID=UPI003464D1DC
MWAWLEPVDRVLWELRWPLLLYFGGLLVCYLTIDSIRYWIHEWRQDKIEARFRKADLAAVDQMDRQEFLHYLTYLFQCAGFKVRPTPPARNYGVDLVLAHPISEERIAVQAHQGADPLKARPVEEVAAARALYQCTRAMVITTGDFTPEAREQAEEAGVTLVDRTKLQELMALTLGSVPMPEREPESEPEAEPEPAVSNG